jgi:hypothetical protein
MQATLQDIFRCVRAAEETITATRPTSKGKDKRFK